MPAQHGFEIVVGGIAHEWRQTVDRDPAACGIEPCLGQAQRGGAVGDVTLERAPIGLDELRETRGLLARERGVGLGGREVAHQPDDVSRRRPELGEPVAAHSRVELEMDAQALRDVAVADGNLDVCVSRSSDLARLERA